MTRVNLLFRYFKIVFFPFTARISSLANTVLWLDSTLNRLSENFENKNPRPNCFSCRLACWIVLEKQKTFSIGHSFSQSPTNLCSELEQHRSVRSHCVPLMAVTVSTHLSISLPCQRAIFQKHSFSPGILLTGFLNILLNFFLSLEYHDIFKL